MPGGVHPFTLLGDQTVPIPHSIYSMGENGTS